MNIAVSVMRDLILKKLRAYRMPKKTKKRGDPERFKNGRNQSFKYGRAEDLLLFCKEYEMKRTFRHYFSSKRRTGSSMRSILDTIPGSVKREKSMLSKIWKHKKVRAAQSKIVSMHGMNQNWPNPSGTDCYRKGIVSFPPKCNRFDAVGYIRKKRAVMISR
jgi:hypothetical protein